MAPEERLKRASNSAKKIRRRKLKDGLCTRCKDVPAAEGGRTCNKCREKGRKYVMRSYLRKRGELDEW